MPSILQFTASVAGLAFASVSLFGWGTIVRCITRTSNELWPVTIVLGLCTVLMIGGLVNVARIAFAESLWSIAIAGFLLAVFHFMRSKFSFAAIIRLRPASITWIEAASVSIFIVLVIGFTIATQLPPDAFNVDDDLQTYFLFPVRQLQTGTVS